MALFEPQTPPGPAAGELYDQVRLHEHLQPGTEAFRKRLHDLLAEHGLCTAIHPEAD